MALYRDPYMRLRELGGLTERPDTSSVASAEELAREQRRAEYGQRSDFSNAFHQGVEDIRSSGYAARGLLRVGVGDEEGGVGDLQRAQEITQQADEFGPEVSSLEDVDGVGSAFQYAGNSLARLAPSILASVGTGLAGGAARVGAATLGRRAASRYAVDRLGRAVATNVAERAAVRRAEREGTEGVINATVTREMEDRARRRVAAKLPQTSLADAFDKGAKRGALAGSIVQQASLAPDVVLDPDGEGSLRERAGIAAAGAAVTGALDALPIIGLLGRYGLADAAKKEITGTLSQRVAKHALKQGVEESTTEAAQAFGERLTHKFVNDNVDLLSPDALSEYVNSAAAGFIGGGVFGAPAGLRGRGREDAGGKRWADSFRNYMGKFQRPKPTGPATIDGATGEVEDDTAFDTGPVVDAIKRAGQTVRASAGAAAEAAVPAASKIADKVGTALKDVSAQVQQHINDLMGDTAVDNSVADILDAAPFEARDVGTGVMLNEGNGIGAVKQFVDANRVRELRANGLDAFQSVASAFVPDETLAARLHLSGAVEEAGKALRGADPATLDEAKITEYQNALPEDARNAFNRAAHTAWSLGQQDNVEIAPEGAAADGAQEDNAEPMDEERPLPSLDKSIAQWRRKGGKVTGATPRNALVFTDGEGTRRAFTGESLGRMLVEHRREDQEFARLPLAHQVATVLGDFQRNGFSIDPGSLQALTLGKGWMLPQQAVAQLRNGLAPTQPAKATAPTQRATVTAPKSEQEQRELNAEYGRDGGIDEAGDEDPARLDEEAIARERAPIVGGTPNTNLLDGRTADSGTIDTEALRAEREATAPDDFNDLDRLLEAHTGEHPNGDFERRRDLFAQAMRDPKLQVSQKARLREAAERYGEAQRAAALRKVETLTTKWRAALRRQTEKPSKANSEAVVAAFAALKKARKNLARQNATVEARGTTPRGGVARGGEEGAARRQQQMQDVAARTGAKSIAEQLTTRDGKPFAEAVDNDVSAAREDVLEQVANAVGTRSRRELYALKERVALSNMSQATKDALLAQIDGEIDALRAALQQASQADLAANDRRTVKGDHFAAAKAALKRASDVPGALVLVRPLATAEQKALIQQLLDMKALRGVPFKLVTNPIRAGSVSGMHVAATSTAGSIESRVFLEMANSEAPASVDAIAVLLHEAVHAATAHAEQRNDAARAELQALLDHVRTEAVKRGYDPDAFYGLGETQEFLAEAFTNPELQRILQAIPAPGEQAKGAAPQTAWERFKAWVAKLLGFDQPSVPDAARSALDAALEQGLALAQETADARRAAYAAVFGDTAADFSPGSMAATPAAGAAPADYLTLLPPDARRFLAAAFQRAEVRRQVEAVLPPDQRAVLASADEGPALLVNTGLALALQGKLDLSHDADTFKGFVQGLWEVISQVLQVPSKTAYAREIVRQLQHGVDPAKVAPREALLSPTALKITQFANTNVVPKVRAFARDMDGRLRSTGVPALTQLATLLAQRTGEFRADGQTAYSARVTAERNKRLNDAFAIVGKWDAAKKAAVLKELQENTTTPSPEATALRGFFKDMRDYLVAAGVQLGNTENYFPVSVDPEAIAADKDGFVALMSAPEFAAELKSRKLTPDALFAAANGWNSQTTVGDTTFADGDHDPNFRPENRRLMDFVYKLGTPEQIAAFAKYQDANLDRVLVQYTSRAVRRAEWERMQLGTKIKSLMTQAKQQGATDAQLQMAHDYVDMVMGTYGGDWNPMLKKLADTLGFSLPSFDKYRKLQASLVTYQNWRLLPLAAMSSLIDPLGVSVRNGDLTGVFDSYKQAVRAMRDKAGTDALSQLAHSMGIVERHAVNEAIAHLYGSIHDPTGRNAKLNAILFKVNGLEYITKFSRLAALAAGNAFLIRHAASKSEESQRYLTELGVTSDDVVTGADGYVVRNDKIDAALNRFVNEAVVRPAPGQRPAWHNDPNFQLAAQYKGYLYSFFNTVTRRAAHELDKGNLGVLLPLLMYLPVTALGEVLRDLLQGDGQNKDAVDYAKQAVVRSGILGPHVGTLTDVRGDLSHGHIALSAVGGPTGQQLGKAYDAVAQSGPVGDVAEEALPASTLYKDWN